MIDLALSILCSSLIFVIFKLFSRFKIQTLYAIIINYITACGVGLLVHNTPFSILEIPTEKWFIWTVFLGVLFIIIFNLMAKTSQVLGVSVASVATKMSLTIPVLLGVFLYNEELGGIKILGVLLALAAVYFASVKKGTTSLRKRALYLPLLVFLGSGVIDASLQYAEQHLISKEEFPLFSSTIFACAAICGICFVFIQSLKDRIKVNTMSIIGGITLGIPNYFSIYFLLRALQNEVLNSASVFTINNVAIVMFSTLLGILLFKEVISAKNWIGIGLAVLSIILVAVF